MLFTNATLLPELLEQLEAYMGFSGENWPIKLKKKDMHKRKRFRLSVRSEERRGNRGNRWIEGGADGVGAGPGSTLGQPVAL